MFVNLSVPSAVVIAVVLYVVPLGKVREMSEVEVVVADRIALHELLDRRHFRVARNPFSIFVCAGPSVPSARRRQRQRESDCCAACARSAPRRTFSEIRHVYSFRSAKAICLATRARPWPLLGRERHADPSPRRVRFFSFVGSAAARAPGKSRERQGRAENVRGRKSATLGRVVLDRTCVPRGSLVTSSG